MDRSIRAVAGEEPVEEGAGETVHTIESMALTAVDQIWTCSEEDRALLPELHPEISADKLRVVPNAVPVPDSPPCPGRPERVLFTGMLNYYPNMAAVEEILLRIAPTLTARGSELPVVIAGGYPGERIVDLSRSQRTRLVANPADMQPLIEGSISIVPLTIGSGSRFKILEAFALGAPVVSTLKGAEGLRATPGKQYRLAESAGEFAAEILGLERDEELRSAIAGSAWELVRDRYSILAVRRHLKQTVVAGAGADDPWPQHRR
jgi:glycosyltransferase involved in cell wall biosynthesis